MMRKIKVAAVIIIILYLILAPIKYHYFDIYLLTLNGKIQGIEKNRKERMHVIVSGEYHDFGHDWPDFQKQAEVGDSVYKKSKVYEIVLVKKKTGQRIVCAYK